VIDRRDSGCRPPLTRVALHVLHLLNPGDGSESVFRAAGFCAAGSTAVRHLIVSVAGDAATAPIPLQTDHRLVGTIASLVADVVRVRRTAREAGVGVIHAWGSAAARITALAAGSTPWVASGVPADWTPPPGARPPRCRVTTELLAPSEYRPPAEQIETGEVVIPPLQPLERARPDRATARQALGVADGAALVLCSPPLTMRTNVPTALWACALAGRFHHGLTAAVLAPAQRGWRHTFDHPTMGLRVVYLPSDADWPTAGAGADAVVHTGDEVSPGLLYAIAAAAPPVVPNNRLWKHRLGKCAAYPFGTAAAAYAQTIHRLLTEPAASQGLGRAASARLTALPKFDAESLYLALVL
jgi:hypothetical protein